MKWIFKESLAVEMFWERTLIWWMSKSLTEIEAERQGEQSTLEKESCLFGRECAQLWCSCTESLPQHVSSQWGLDHTTDALAEPLTIFFLSPSQNSLQRSARSHVLPSDLQLSIFPPSLGIFILIYCQFWRKTLSCLFKTTGYCQAGETGDRFQAGMISSEDNW